jgi:hypothetical protein
MARSPNSSPRMRPLFDGGRRRRPFFALCCYLRGVNSLLHPNRYRDRSDPAALTLQVHDDPPTRTLLNVFELQRGELSAMP